MKSSVKIQGASALVKKFREHPELVNRTLLSVAKEEARALCVEYGRLSGPGDGLTEAPLERARDAVRVDVGRVFATRDSPWRVFELLQARAPKYANAYWHAYKSKKPRAMAEILRKAGVPQGMDPAAQRAARVGAGGRVPKEFHRVSLANSAQVRVLVRKLQARVGMAKAGWLCAAKALGGRIRTKYLRSDKIVTVEKFPESVRKVARKFPGLGGARITATATRVDIEIFTSAGHASKALSDSDYEKATEAARQKLAAHFLLALREVNKRLGGKAA